MNITTKLVRITNSDLSRYSTGTSTNLSWQSNDSDLGQIHKLHLKTAIFPNTMYNINRYNQVLNITAPDMAPVNPIPVGQYSIVEYIAALKVVLDIAAAPNTFTIVQNPLTKKLVFTKSAGAEFLLPGIDTNAQSRESGSKVETLSAGLTATASGMPDLSGLRHIYVESMTAGKQLLTGNVNKYHVIADLPIAVPFGAYQTYNFDESTLNQVTYRGAKQLAKIDIRFTDDRNRELDLNGIDWVLIFEAHGLNP